MKKLLTLLLTATFISCNTTITTKGDLSFKLISFNSLYDANSEQIAQLEKVLDSINDDPNAKKQDKELSAFFSKLKEHDLFTSPYINLRIGTDSTLVVYLSASEYDKVKGFSRSDLNKRHKKVELELEVIKKDSGIYYSDQIISVNEVDGQTYWRK